MPHHSEETITIHGGSVGECGGIVEKVAASIKAQVPNGYGMSIAEAEDYAQAAIRATIEHLKMHISDGMLAASRKTGVPGFYLPTDDSDKFRAMLNTALSDLEES